MSDMDVFYTIDAFITRKLKAIDAKLQLYGITSPHQRLFNVMLMAVGFNIFGKLFPESFLTLLLIFPIIIVYGVTIFLFSLVLYQLHIYFDEKGAKRLSKEYSDGYLAWSCVIMTILTTTAMFSLTGLLIGGIFMYMAIPSYGLIYFAFVARQINKTGLKKPKQSLVGRFVDSISPVVLGTN